jgi:tetratricopeptide (TPR) repeat protein
MEEGNNLQEKLRDMEEWNEERARIKPVLDRAVEFHNKARHEVYWKNYEKASEFYREAIKNYKATLNLTPKYYLNDILERVDSVIEEHINTTFNLKISADRLTTEYGISDLVSFIEGLNPEEKSYIDSYSIAVSYLKIADIYYEEDNFNKAYEFYKRVLDVQCDRSFVNTDAHHKMGKILFYKKRYKEALVSFVSVLSFDKNFSEAIDYIDKCLKELGIYKYKARFLSATPNEAKKLIMEVL